jgi:hypothetical protein
MSLYDSSSDVNSVTIGPAMAHRIAHSKHGPNIDWLRGIGVRNAANATHLLA